MYGIVWKSRQLILFDLENDTLQIRSETKNWWRPSHESPQLTTCAVDLSLTYGIMSLVSQCSVFLAGILFRMHSTNGVAKLILNSYNFETTTMRPLVIATLVSCVKWPLIPRPTVATKMLAAWSSVCGFSIRNICHHHFKYAAHCRNRRHSNYAIWNECGEDRLLY